MRAIAIFSSCAVAAFVHPPSAHAQVSTAAELREIEAQVPERYFYPAGYYDVRIGAEAHLAQWSRSEGDLISDCPEGDGQCYEVVDCAAEPVPPLQHDPIFARYGALALETSRLRQELEQIGYPATVYSGPIADYEQRTFANATMPEGISTGDPRAELVAAIEVNRKRFAPNLPRVVNAAPCDPLPDGPIVVRTVPDGGEIFLINAFAFRVCTRREPDPWDRFACRWNEWVAGEPRSRPYGRFVYQVTWPDGAERRGTREISPGMGEETATVTFRK